MPLRTRRPLSFGGPKGRGLLRCPAVQGAWIKKFRWRRPRHSLKGRQDADAVDRVGIRLACARRSRSGDIVLLFSKAAIAALAARTH